MLVELIGCTGVGKSTLVKKILCSCHENGIAASTGDQFVLQQMKLNWIKNHILRTLFVDILTFSACVLTLGSNSKLYGLVIKIVRQLPSSVNRFEKFNIIRNSLKKIGAFEIVRFQNSNEQIIFFDEGTIHTAHYLFVHTSIAPPIKYISRFLQLIHLPDVIISKHVDEAILVERTLARHHNRIPDRSYNSTKFFIKNAVDTFNRVESQPEVAERLIIIKENGDIKPASNKRPSPHIEKVLNLIRDTYNKIEKDKAENNYV